MKTVLTDLGIQKVLEASTDGPLIKITSVKIGSSIINPLSTMIDITDQVWSGGPSFINYHVVDQNTFLFRITLDESIGDFNIGNIGLFLEDGTMFSITTLIGLESKIAASVSSSGNRRIYEIMITISNLTDLIDVTILNSSSANLSTLQNETLLPAPQNSTFDCYLIQYHTGLKTSCIAILNGERWVMIPPASPEKDFNFELAQFDTSTNVGDAVAFDASTGQFIPASNTAGYLGLRDSNNMAVNVGIYHSERLNLTPGLTYYVDNGNPGKLTTTQSPNFVGIAIDKNTIYLGTKHESTLFKTNAIDRNNPSTLKYPSEKAVVDLANSSTPYSTIVGSQLNWNQAAAVGTSNQVARADHTHIINTGSYYATCNTAAGTAAKSVTTSLNSATFKLEPGVKVVINWLQNQSATNPTLNVNGTGAKTIRIGNHNGQPGCFFQGDIVEFIYDGSNWKATNWSWVRRQQSGNNYVFIDSSGFKIQGGYIYVSTQATVTFPIAFSQSPLSITTNPRTVSTGDYNYITLPVNGSITNTGFALRFWDSDGNAGRQGDCSWMAMGW